MKLTQVDITNFRCFESLTVPLQPDVNVFVGVNASGKTTHLGCYCHHALRHRRCDWRG